MSSWIEALRVSLSAKEKAAAEAPRSVPMTPIRKPAD
jgi:hypothetical protein